MNTPEPQFDLSTTPTLAMGTLVTWEDAEAAIIEHGRQWLREYERWYGSINTHRSWLAMRAARITVGRNVALALATLQINLYRQGRKRGVAASLLLGALACLFLGCTVTEATLSDGSRVKRVNWLFTTRFAEATLRGTNGASVRLKGYSSDVEAVAEAVARGAVSGAKP